MCGLFGGTSTFLTQDEMSKIAHLGILSWFRGMHSTGMVHICKPVGRPNPLRVRYRKSTSDPIGFFRNPEIASIIEEKDRSSVALVGHTRQATIGDVKAINAHPYKHQHIVGVHNGTIRAFQPLNGEGTDSNVLFQKLATQGLVKTLSQVGDGAFALVWVDKSDMTLNFIRNEKRPLWFASNTANNTLYWASEERMLSYVLGGSARIAWELPVDRLAKVKLGEIEMTQEDITYEKPKVFSYTPGGGYSDWWENRANGESSPNYANVLDEQGNRKRYPPYQYEDKRQVPYQSSALLPDLRKDRETTQHVPKIMYKGYQGQLHTLQEARKLLGHGCAVSTQIYTVHDSVYWFSPDDYISAEYKDQEWVREYCNFVHLDEGKLVKTGEEEDYEAPFRY